MADIATIVVRRRRWVALGFLVVAVALLPFAPLASDTFEVGGSAVNESESASVDLILANEFTAPFANNLILVATGIPSVDEDAGLDLLVEIVDEVAYASDVTGVLSYIDTEDAAFVTPHGTFVVVGIAGDAMRMDEVVLELRGLTDALQTRMKPGYPTIELAWTGAAAFDYDVRLTSASDATDAELRVLPVTLVLLLIVFGGAVAALCPVLTGGFAVGLSLGAAVLISRSWPMTALLQNIVSMIGLGIGIDYSLLMISRFREELRADPDPERAATAALRTAGHTIVLSGGAVAIGFAALLIVPATELRSIAMGGLLVVGFSICLATLLLPGLLTCLGSRVEAGRLWRPRAVTRSPRRWRRWGRWVAAHPLRVLLLVALPLAALASQARHISTDIPSSNWLPEQMESTRGAVALHQMGQSGIVQTLHLLIEFPPDRAADSAAAWQRVLALGDEIADDPRVARVHSLPRLLNLETVEAVLSADIPDELRAAYVSKDARFASIDVVPSESASAGELMRYVRELRETKNLSNDDSENVRVLVGGLPANNADYQDAIGGSVVDIVLLIVLGSFAALLIGFRSVLGALKAVVLNLFSVAAAMGVTVLVFQYGYGSEWLGVADPLDGLFPAVPIIVFCVVFGLSMDYEVFLLSRVAEGVHKGMSNHDALVDGLARTGGIITSAALVMIVVFAGFSLGDFLVVKILGFSLAVAVFIDATLVRLAIGPALLQLGGRWNWWPGKL